MNGCTKIVMFHLASHAQTEHIVRGRGVGGHGDQHEREGGQVRSEGIMGRGGIEPVSSDFKKTWWWFQRVASSDESFCKNVLKGILDLSHVLGRIEWMTRTTRVQFQFQSFFLFYFWSDVSLVILRRKWFSIVRGKPDACCFFRAMDWIFYLRLIGLAVNLSTRTAAA